LAARLFKTRELAATACDGGKVEVNGISGKPHKAVRCGDRLRLTTVAGKHELIVRGLGERRLPPAEARLLYDDVTPAPPPSPELPTGPLVRRERGSGRPTKRDRRATDQMRWR